MALKLKELAIFVSSFFYCFKFSSIITSRIRFQSKEELYMFEKIKYDPTEQDKPFPLYNDGIEENDDDYEFEEYNCD